MKLRFVFGLLLCFCFVAVAVSQDAAKVDPKHYKVEMENDQVRILRVHYGPHEKSVMHSHPDSAAIFLSDGKIMFTYPNGKTETAVAKSGQAMFTPAQVHDPENTGDAATDIILVELKGGAAKK